MIRLLGGALVGAIALSGAAPEPGRLAKEDYIAAVRAIAPGAAADRLSEQAVDFDLPGMWPANRGRWLRAERRMRAELDRSADRLQDVTPPAEVAQTHAAWISALRSCAHRVAALETTSPLDPLIAYRMLTPCFEAVRRVCDGFDARGYFA